MDRCEVKFMHNDNCVKTLHTDLLSALHYALIIEPRELVYTHIIVDDEFYAQWFDVFEKYIELNKYCKNVYGEFFDDTDYVTMCNEYNHGLRDMLLNPNKYYDAI